VHTQSGEFLAKVRRCPVGNKIGSGNLTVIGTARLIVPTVFAAVESGKTFFAEFSKTHLFV
jgi:hypothetical protein